MTPVDPSRVDPARDRRDDAKTRLHDLDHAVDEARAAADAAPADAAALAKVAMTTSIRDVARRDLDDAENALAASARP